MTKSILIVLLFITASTTHFASGVVFVKCCARNEHLHSNLKNCVPLRTTDAHNTSQITRANNTNVLPVPRTERTLVSTTSPSTSVTSQTIINNNNSSNNIVSNSDKTERNSLEFNWLPDQLRAGVRNNHVIFGSQNNCSESSTVRLKTPHDNHRFELLVNGSLLLQSFTATNELKPHMFDSLEFCTDTYTDLNGSQEHAVLLCPCHKVRCIRKCCDMGKARFYRNSKPVCDYYNITWKPFYLDLPAPNKSISFEVVTGVPINCPKGYSQKNSPLIALPSHVIETYWESMVNDENACEDTLVRSGVPKAIFRCSKEFPFKSVTPLANRLHAPEAVLWLLIVLTTLIVPRRRVSEYSRVHDMALLWHAFCLLTRCVAWISYVKCYYSPAYLPIVLYFCSVAASFWLNVLCVNMTVGFWRPLAPQSTRGHCCSGMPLWYSLYAWGASGAMTAFTAAMWYSETIPKGLLRPTMHEARTCFREQRSTGKMGTFSYFYGPVSGLLIVNALLFSSTACRVRQLRRDSSFLDKRCQTTGRKKKERAFRNEKSAITYIKLLFLMGVFEIAVEIAAWLCDPEGYIFRMATSCIDLLRAAAMFYLCCCKKRTLRALRDRVCACAVVKFWQQWRIGRSTGPADSQQIPGQNSTTVTDFSSNTDVTQCDLEVSAKTDNETQL